MQIREGQRKRGRERIPSGILAVSAEPDVGLGPMNRENVTRNQDSDTSQAPPGSERLDLICTLARHEESFPVVTTQIDAWAQRVMALGSWREEPHCLG